MPVIFTTRQGLNEGLGTVPGQSGTKNAASRPQTGASPPPANYRILLEDSSGYVRLEAASGYIELENGP